jgi:hypothetical protein
MKNKDKQMSFNRVTNELKNGSTPNYAIGNIGFCYGGRYKIWCEKVGGLWIALEKKPKTKFSAEDIEKQYTFKNIVED